MMMHYYTQVLSTFGMRPSEHRMHIYLDCKRLKGPAVGLQVDALLRQIAEYNEDVDVAIVALETLAKIAWNDDEVTLINHTDHGFHSPCQTPSQRCFLLYALGTLCRVPCLHRHS